MSQEIQLYRALQSVHDEETFHQFLVALRDDRVASIGKGEAIPNSPYKPKASGWENRTIECFLGTAARWARDSFYGNPFFQKPNNSWRRCADMMFAEKIYEMPSRGTKHC